MLPLNGVYCERKSLHIAFNGYTYIQNPKIIIPSTATHQAILSEPRPEKGGIRRSGSKKGAWRWSAVPYELIKCLKKLNYENFCDKNLI